MLMEHDYGVGGREENLLAQLMVRLFVRIHNRERRRDGGWGRRDGVGKEGWGRGRRTGERGTSAGGSETAGWGWTGWGGGFSVFVFDSLTLLCVYFLWLLGLFYLFACGG